ncbi:hypothetical protein Y032_0277g1103 [Ancylostoma ceylanicum]|uniref:Uncharacterized protein n=1 Tax=Ancylostoma ceylanicum TaxID=53326 RepID=A0A016S852_9BILA|nr:hypothetical protein Y032_0277g1103 [Ancylostoma ceylanicum]
MHIENVEEFTTWLIAELTPICDAEPGALAKYVLALLRKPNKSDEEMRAFSTDQLEVFLQGKALPTGRGVSHNGRAPRAVLRLCPHRTVSPGHGVRCIWFDRGNFLPIAENRAFEKKMKIWHVAGRDEDPTLPCT